jgi:predicted tellurium resistance membrane protein TerC
MNEALISLFTLSILEIVLGIDNIIFITILAGKAEEQHQSKARTIGLLMGMIVRILMLFGINYIQQQTNPIISVSELHLTAKDLLLLGGGMFLLFQSVREIHLKMIGQTHEEQESGKKYGWSTLMLQLLLINSVFSLDSVITAIGMADHLWVMITAVILSMIVMLMASRPIAEYVNQNPSIKILALSFLVLIGVSLLYEGFHQHLNKGYVYFAMAFSFTLELINLRIDKVRAVRKAKK